MYIADDKARILTTEIQYDDYKKIMIWNFNVKKYSISIELNSSWVSFIVCGEYRLQHQLTHSSYWVRKWREQRRKKHLLIKNIEDASKRSEYETEQIQNLLNEFQKEKGFKDDISPKDFNDKYADQLARDIYKRCPSGRITGLLAIREMNKYPVVSGEIIKVKGYCLIKS